MLVTKAAKDGDVVTLLLISGGEIIGKLVSRNDKDIILSRPRMPMQGKDGKSVTFAPVTATGELDSEAVVFERHTVVCTVPTNAQFLDIYTQAVSGIIAPVSTLIK